MPHRKSAKDKVLLTLKQAESRAAADVARWNTTVAQYDADMIFNQEHGLPNLPAIESSRDLAKQELAEAREVHRLYKISINAVMAA